MANLNLIEINQSQKNEYNHFVASSPSGSFLQSWEWGQWQERLGKKAFRFFVADDENGIKASLQAIQSPLPFGQFYLYIPYGPVVQNNFQFSIFNFQLIFNELISKFPSAVFIRIEPKATFHFPPSTFGLPIHKSVNIQPGKTLVIDLTKPEQQLLAEMHPKTRYNIKVAQRHGVEISSGLMAVPGHGLYIKEVLDLITSTADRQNFQTFPLSYYEGLLDFFSMRNPTGQMKLYIYKALLNRELLSAAIMVDFGGSRTYLFGGSAAHHREVMAPHLLHFTAMMDAKKLGLNNYDFWGIETSAGDTPGFARFKMGFAPQLGSGPSAPQSDSGPSGGGIRVYPGAYDIAGKKLWYHGYKALRQANRTWLFMKTLGKFRKK